MQTKVMTFLLPLALIRTQLWCVRVCAPVRVCVLHSHCLVASACLDQLSVWYLYGSNFSQCILVMVLCSQCTRADRPSLSASLSPPETHCVCVTPAALHQARLEYFPQTLSSYHTWKFTAVLTGLHCTSKSEQHMYTVTHTQNIVIKVNVWSCLEWD